MPGKTKALADLSTTYLNAVNAETPGVKKWEGGE
jgi:hypothetical protein